MRTKQYIKEINKYSCNLSDENKEKFDELLIKIRFSNINDHDAEEFSHHCLDLFLQAEQDNVPIEDVLNTTDINSFCDNFIKETKSEYSIWQKIYAYFKNIPMIIFIFTGVFEILVGYLIKAWIRKETLFTVPFTLSMLANTILVILFIYILFAKAPSMYIIFNSDDKKKDRIATFILWLFCCALVGLFVLSKLFLTTVLFNVNYLIFMGVLGAIMLIQHLFEKRKDK